MDTKGQQCPAPLIATRRALRESAQGESFMVLTDNLTSFNNVSRFLRETGTGFSVSESGGTWTLKVTKTNGESPARVEEYCVTTPAHFEKGDFIVAISSNKMGEGEEELGNLLMVNFLKALKDLDHLPDRIVFYNSGVKLAANDSPVISHLRDLERMGVGLLLCSTCVSFYSLEQSLGAGTISDMFTIAEAMTTAGNVIKP